MASFHSEGSLFVRIEFCWASRIEILDCIQLKLHCMTLHHTALHTVPDIHACTHAYRRVRARFFFWRTLARPDEP